MGKLLLSDISRSNSSSVRQFNVDIRLEAKFSFYALEDALQGKSMSVPYDRIEALFVIMRHFPSRRYTPVGCSFFSPSHNKIRSEAYARPGSSFISRCYRRSGK